MKGLKIINCISCPYSSEEDMAGQVYCLETDALVHGTSDMRVSDYEESIHPDCPLPDTLEDFAIRVGSGLDLIIKERERQISEEGWTPEHDKVHINNELAIAAACYALHGNAQGAAAIVKLSLEDAWPLDIDADKRHKHGYVKRLTIAGALIAAELDRLVDSE